MDAAVGTETDAGCGAAAVDDGAVGSAETLVPSEADRSGTPDGSPSLNSEYPSPAISKRPTDTATHRPTHHPAFILTILSLCCRPISPMATLKAE